MGQQPSQESKYSVELQIDKNSYQIQDTIIGYVEYQATQSSTKYDLELRLQFIAEYQSQKNLGDNKFIFKDEQIKNCTKEDLEIRYQASFQFDLDLISTTAAEEDWFIIKYYVRALIQHRIGPQIYYIQYKDIQFQINRPFVRIYKPYQMEIQNQIKTVFCCNYGQVKLKVSLDQKDFLINDVAQIKIDCDQSLSTKNIVSFQINLLSRMIYRDSTSTSQAQHVFNTVSVSSEQTKKCQLKQSLHLIAQENFNYCFHSSLECPNFTYSYFIQIICNYGSFTDQISLEIPINLYWTQQHQLDISTRLAINRKEFNQDFYLQFMSDRFIQINIKQEKWNDQKIDFPSNDQQQRQNQENQQNNNLIIIQSNQK